MATVLKIGHLVCPGVCLDTGLIRAERVENGKNGNGGKWLHHERRCNQSSIKKKALETEYHLTRVSPGALEIQQ